MEQIAKETQARYKTVKDPTDGSICIYKKRGFWIFTWWENVYYTTSELNAESYVRLLMEHDEKAKQPKETRYYK